MWTPRIQGGQTVTALCCQRAMYAPVSYTHLVAVNCLELSQEEINDLLKGVLYEFPIKELDLFLPPWVDALPQEHPIKAELYSAIREGTSELRFDAVSYTHLAICVCVIATAASSQQGQRHGRSHSQS